MTHSDALVRRVVRDIEVRDLLARHDHGRRSYTDVDLDEAYERGAADARTALMAEREDAVRGLSASLQQSAAALRQSLADLRTHYRDRVVDDAFTFATWLVGRAIAADPELMRARVDDALSGIEDETPLVSVAPCVAELVATWLPAAIVRPDPSLLPGEVLVTASATTIDGTFDDALQRLRAAFGSDIEVTS
jgi:flagellar biosynthesis/type III secretory pathway protein FliH